MLRAIRQLVYTSINDSGRWFTQHSRASHSLQRCYVSQPQAQPRPNAFYLAGRLQLHYPTSPGGLFPRRVNLGRQGPGTRSQSCAMATRAPTRVQEKETKDQSPNIPSDDGPEILAGAKSDFNVIKETFALRDVPREVLLFGLAGLVPYMMTSSTTLFLAYDINNIQTAGRGYVFTQETASALLDFLEPVQVGFGAVILSFLGAIHWGLEFAGFGGHAAYRRYFLGILAPTLAWPTVFMPFDYALLTQFLGFTGMYFADAQATTKGWAPRWYTTYRFVLTFIVGASIVVTLVGRGKIGDRVVSYMPSPDSRTSSLKSTQAIGYEEGKSPREFQVVLKKGEDLAREAEMEEEDDSNDAKDDAAEEGESLVEAKSDADDGKAFEDKPAEKKKSKPSSGDGNKLKDKKRKE